MSACITMIFLIQIVQPIEMGCGLVQHKFIHTIQYGREVLRGAWPFIAALHYKKPNKVKCGGTVLSTKHVLTGNAKLGFCAAVKFDGKF